MQMRLGVEWKDKGQGSSLRMPVVGRINDESNQSNSTMSIKSDGIECRVNEVKHTTLTSLDGLAT